MENEDLIYYIAMVSTASLIMLIIFAVKLNDLNTQANALLSTLNNAEQNALNKLGLND